MEKNFEIQKSRICFELVSNKGGLSLFLGREFNMNVICSDLFDPKNVAKTIHEGYGVQNKISYESIDCTSIPYPNEYFDVICFKSMIGYLSTYDKQKLAISEMYLVLKPGGILLFVENCKGSLMHNFLRRKFVPWGSFWKYVDYEKN